MPRSIASTGVLDGLPFGVAYFGADGCCVHANATFAELMSTPASPEGVSIADIGRSCFGEDDARGLAEDFTAAVRDRSQRPLRQCGSPDGRRFDCVWRAWDGERAVAVLGVVDVSHHAERREALEEEAGLAAALTEIETTLGYTTDFDDILGALVSDAPDGVGCPSAAAFEWAAGAWVVRHVRALPRALLAERLETGDIPGAADALAQRRPVRARPRSAGALAGGHSLAVPLAVSGEISALLLLTGAARPFTDAAVAFGDKLSTIASFALENARLQTAERETREALQTALLGVVREVPGIKLGHLYRSATRHAQVGGDFYEVFVMGDERVGVLMGDVSGKGIGAASLAALTKTTVKIHARELGSPASVLAKTNEVLVDECAASAFVTALYAVIDTATGEMRYCSAGHPPGILRRVDGTASLLSSASPILGAYLDLDYEERQTTMENGDVLLLYTDGVTEARRAGHLYGHERLLLLVKRLGRIDPRELPEIVFEDVFAHVRGDLTDDMAILALSPTHVSGELRQQRLPL